MSKQYYQSQYILNKCFENRDSVMRVSLNNAQDYLNAIFDNSRDSLRVNINGGMLPVIYDPADLPSYASDGQICPVYNEERGVVDFYKWSDASSEWLFVGSTVSGNALSDDEKESVEWVAEHIDQIKQVADFGYIVNVDDIVLDPTSRVVTVQGQEQDIDDDLDGDGDDSTPYRIDFSGYVLSVSAYQTEDAPIPERYYTRITYESGSGGLGNSHIYLQQDEYDYFAAYQGGKNILRVFYLTNAASSPIKKRRLVLNADGTATDGEGNVYAILDEGNTDGDESTVYRIDVGGYVLGVETYDNNDSKVPEKCYIETVYESDGVHSGKTRIYMDAELYDGFAVLSNGKNIMDIYYLSTVFPASVTISETQYMFPDDSVEFVAVDASGNVHGISDALDKDGDDSTHIRITVNGYAVDMDGYYSEDDVVKKRLIDVKMCYNYGIDTTDIYVDRDYYDHVSQLGNGRNIVSIYTIGAGIGVDASRIQSADSALDATSEKPIQNKAVKEAFDSLLQEIQSLKDRIAELEG